MAAPEDELSQRIARLALRPRAPTVLVFQALPLCGKSTLARGLCELLLRCGAVPRWLNQDELVTRGNRRSAFLALIAETLADSAVTHVIVDKTNIEEQNMADYCEHFSPAAVIRLRHPADAPGSMRLLVAEARRRFYLRGEGHRTLRPPPLPPPHHYAPHAPATAAAPNIDAILGFFAGKADARHVCGGLPRGTRAGAAATSSPSAPPRDALEACALNINVLLSPTEALASLWSALLRRGLVPAAFSPPLAHAAVFATAAENARAYERYLAAWPAAPLTPTRLFGVQLGERARQALLARLPPSAPRVLAPGAHADAAAAGSAAVLLAAPELHLTLAYTGCALDHLAELRWGPRLARGDVGVDIAVVGFAWDGRCLCALCPGIVGEADGGVRNRHGHLTMALAAHTPSVYSNALLHRLLDEGDRSGGGELVMLDEPLRLHGALHRFPPRAPALVAAAGSSAGAGGGAVATSVGDDPARVPRASGVDEDGSGCSGGGGSGGVGGNGSGGGSGGSGGRGGGGDRE